MLLLWHNNLFFFLLLLLVINRIINHQLSCLSVFIALFRYLLRVNHYPVDDFNYEEEEMLNRREANPTSPSKGRKVDDLIFFPRSYYYKE